MVSGAREDPSIRDKEWDAAQAGRQADEDGDAGEGGAFGNAGMRGDIEQPAAQRTQ